MTRSSIISFLLGAVVVVTIYELAGLRTREHAPEVSATKPAETPAPPRGGATPPRAALPQPAKPVTAHDAESIAKLQAEAAQAKSRAEFAEQQLEAVEGRAIPWPASVAPQFKKEAVEQQLKEFVVDRGLAKLKSIDCSEYPCVEVLELTNTGPDATNTLRAALTDMVRRYYGNNVVLSIQGSRSERGSSTATLAGIGIAPTDEDVRTRARHRALQAVQEFNP